MTIGQMLFQWLTKLDWFSTLFPRIPVPVQKQIESKIDNYCRTNNVNLANQSTSQAVAEPERKFERGPERGPERGFERGPERSREAPPVAERGNSRNERDRYERSNRYEERPYETSRRERNYRSRSRSREREHRHR